MHMFTKSVIGGLQGPTISPVIAPENAREKGGWYAVHIIVRKDQLAQAISELREIGGSGVVVTPVMYIFEEEPHAYKAMLEALAPRVPTPGPSPEGGTPVRRKGKA